MRIILYLPLITVSAIVAGFIAGLLASCLCLLVEILIAVTAIKVEPLTSRFNLTEEEFWEIKRKLGQIK
jgi:hypothetical protein